MGNQEYVYVTGVKVTRDCIDRLLAGTSPLAYDTHFNNYYLLTSNGEELGAKALIYSCIGGVGHHAYEAVTALLKLGYTVHATSKNRSNSEKFVWWINSGRLVFD